MRTFTVDVADILRNTADMLKGIPENSEEKKATVEMLKEADERVARVNKAADNFKNDRNKEIKDHAHPRKDIKGIKKRMLEEMQKIANDIPVEELNFVLKREQENEEEENEDCDEEENEKNESDEEGEDLVGRMTYINKDPFTKQKIVKPLKNIHCGHVYDENSVLLMLEQNSSGVKCPNMGCPNNKRFKMKDLEPFPDFFKLCRR